MGATRADINAARRLIGERPGWVDRLEAAYRSGAYLPAIALGLIGPAIYDALSEPKSQQ